MTRGPARLDVSVSYALPRAGVPAANSFRKWVAAALHGRIREADLAIRLVDAREGRAAPASGTALERFARADQLDARSAGVELLNVLRPTVAVSWLGSFAALALAATPGEHRARLREDDAELELTLRDLGGKTEVILDQGAFTTEARFELHRGGWTESFEKLRRAL